MARAFTKAGKRFLNLPTNAKLNPREPKSNVELEDGKCCDTPACAGGWLAVLYNTPKDYKYHPECGSKTYRHYSDGADAFARDMGLEDKRVLGMWAHTTPCIWGNPWGLQMFYEAYAYDEGDKVYNSENITTKAIGEKFLAVAKRLELIHKKET